MYLQNLLNNILQFTLRPPNVPLDVACQVLYSQIRELQAGVMLYLGKELGWVFLQGTVGIFRTDTIEGHKLTGHMACTADKGCRVCKVWRCDYSSMTWDVVSNQRTMLGERVIRDEATKLPKGKAKDMMKGAGLNKCRDVFTTGIKADYLRSFPLEIFHSELLGIAKLSFGMFVGFMMKTAQGELALRLREFPKPTNWYGEALPDLKPTEAGDGLTNFQGKSLAKLVQIFPFLING